MVKKKPKVSVKKPYMMRFTSFKNEHCPYCGADGATLEPNRRGYRGHCVLCGAENNFTNPKCKERMER
jgi:hypothetical protein